MIGLSHLPGRSTRSFRLPMIQASGVTRIRCDGRAASSMRGGEASIDSAAAVPVGGGGASTPTRRAVSGPGRFGVDQSLLPAPSQRVGHGFCDGSVERLETAHPQAHPPRADRSVGALCCVLSPAHVGGSGLPPIGARMGNGLSCPDRRPPQARHDRDLSRSLCQMKLSHRLQPFRPHSRSTVRRFGSLG